MNDVPVLTARERAVDQKFCYACGTVLHHSAGSCPKCGATQAGAVMTPAGVPMAGARSPLQHGQVYCRGCGATIHETAANCPQCGAVQRTAAGLISNKSRVTAALLAFLLGGIGAHKFYLGSIFLGLLYLIFVWTFIPAIIAFIEGIYYLTMSDEAFARKYS